MIQADPIRVVDEKMNDVPRDGRTMGEIVMRGNNVMVGYFRDEEATEKAFRGGWLHSGDLGVQHSDGYVELARPGQGHHHLRRGEHLDRRDRARHRGASGGARGRGHRCAGREVGRAAEGLRHPQTGRRGQRGGADRLPPGAHRPIQGAEGRRVRRRAPAHGDRQDRRSSSSAKRNGPATAAGSRDECRHDRPTGPTTRQSSRPPRSAGRWAPTTSGSATN